MRLILASTSPRRSQLLDQIGLEHIVMPAEIDESRRPDEPPGTYVERVARDKAMAIDARDDVVVAADTAVVFEGQILGKPAHPQEARAMLQRLQGERHEVFTCLAVGRGARIESLVDVTHVQMLPMTDDEIARYVADGDPMDKAGSYGLQSRGGVFVESISGSPFTVVGLPLHLLPRLMRRVEVDMEVFRRRDRL
ncbi:MAG TPA: Maf family protein [Acidimicrobiia bacterium]|nr:Maf family protein [Acidimicrobiia bacterium]